MSLKSSSLRPDLGLDAVGIGAAPRRSGRRTTRALVLSGSLGAGHDALAAGCVAVLDDAGIATDTIDMIGSLGNGPAAAADWVFRRLLEIAPVYDAFHFNQLRGAGRLAGLAERLAVEQSTDVVERALERAHSDVILSVFATGAGVASRLKAAGRCARSVVFVPDSCPHRMWVHPNTDLFLVTSALAEASVRRYRPRAPVEVVRPPLKAPFNSPPTKQEARSALGVPTGERCVLVMGGGWGLGPIVETSKALTAAGHHVLALAGRNVTLHHALIEAAAVADHDRLHPIGFVDDVASLMMASDAVVTTPGVTCWESRALGRPLILLDVVPGHGRENLAHELELGGAAVSQPDVAMITDCVEVILEASPAPERAGPDQLGGRDFLWAMVEAGILD
jgi:processive 1,2-diacylglycerol beta-glucosyltransferase